MNSILPLILVSVFFLSLIALSACLINRPYQDKVVTAYIGVEFELDRRENRRFYLPYKSDPDVIAREIVTDVPMSTYVFVSYVNGDCYSYYKLRDSLWLKVPMSGASESQEIILP